jgi:ATP-binding cassette, subfamily B, bacterial PglK
MPVSNRNLLTSYSELWGVLSDLRKFQAKSVLFLMIVASVVEIFSIGLVMPFLTSLSEPEKVVSTLANLIPRLDLSMLNDSDLRLYLLLSFISMTIISGLIRYLLLFLQTRYAHAVGADIGLHVFSTKLHLPFKYHANTKSSKLIADIQRADEVVGQILFPILFIFSSIIMIVFIVLFLIFINPYVIFISIVFFTILYLLILKFTRNKIVNYGEVLNNNIPKRMKALQDGFGAVRDIIIDRSHEYFKDNFWKADRPYRAASASVQIFSAAPRFVVETFGMVFISLIAYISVAKNINFTDQLPLFGVMILAAQRMLPLAQQLYYSITSIRAYRPVFLEILESYNNKNLVFYPEEEIIKYKDKIKINQISFRYGEDTPWLFEDANFEFSKGSSVGLIGESGSGKSAFIDILMGLIDPVKGHIEIDEKKITNNNLFSWWRKIAHVPQNVFLIDDSILENIFFASTSKKSISNAVIAAENAQLKDLIDSLDDGIDTKVGERGSLLSGGQRQRIGIARALYRNPELLILDEATSSLDEQTEKKVIENIFAINPNMTIFMVTHKLSSLSRCDFVMNIENGRMTDIGKYS